MNQWGELRQTLGLSREKFADRVGLTPGAVWRIEAKGKLKPGELERLEALRDAPASAPSPPPEPPQPPTATVAVAAPKSAPQGEVTGTTVLLVDGQLRWSSGVTLTPVLEPPVLNQPELSPYQRFLADGIRRYSNSEIQTFKRCKRKWYLGYYRRLHPITESPVGARAIGDRLHRALRWHYHADPTQRRDVRDALEKIIALDRATLEQHYAPELVPLSLKTKVEQEADLERVMVAGYVEWVAETGADAEFVVTGTEEYVEVEFTEKINGETVMLVGKLDARLRRISDGVRMFLDHKSVGNFEGPTRVLNMNEQMKMYLVIELLLGRTDPDERVGGALFNMLRRCKRTPTAKPPFYQRVEVRHNPVTVDNFTRQLGGVLNQIEATRRALDAGEDHRFVAYPTPSQDCTWSCSFLPLSSLMDDGSYWEAMANSFFEVGDPSAYYVKNTGDAAV